MAAAKRKRPRRSTTARRRSHTSAANPARRHHRRRRTYRRNPPSMFSGRGIAGQAITMLKDGVMGGATVVAGEVATRLISSKVLGMTQGETATTAAQVGIAVAGGIAVEKFVGRQAGRDFVVGGMAGIIRATVKQMAGVTTSPTTSMIAAALSDSGPRILPRRRGAMAGYARPIAGYLGAGSGLSGEVERELGYAE